MMKYVVCGVFDKVANIYMPPLFLRSKGEAIRSFADAVNSAEHQFARHAADYTMFYFGDWDDATAEFTTPAAGPERLVTGFDLLRERPE